MKIYSNHITRMDVDRAFSEARRKYGQDAWIDNIREWKPRNYANGMEVFGFSFNGKVAWGHVPAHSSGPRDDYPRAMSWDAWGYVIALLFNVDPHARVGFYDSEADFVERVRKYRRKGSDLEFLNVLDNIKEYGE